MLKLIRYKSFAIALLCCLLLSGCFKDEPAGTECDIEVVSVEVENPEQVFFHATDAVVTVPAESSTIVFEVRRQADLTALAPVFRLTPGATIVPENGSVHDFSDGPVVYTVTSEDGQWHRTYEVSFRRVTQMKSTTVALDFEHFSLEPAAQKYYLWSESGDDGLTGNVWATGNPGFQLSMGSAKPDAYPTAPYADGYDGSAVCLTTRDTGAFGMMAGKRLAAGNLFLGEFDLSSALKDALHATHFGIPFAKQPLRLTGYYQYQPGPKFQDPKGKIVADRTDEANIYAVLFRNHDEAGNAVVLYGDDVKTSPQIVALADIKPAPAGEWTYFDIAFDYYDDIDLDLLEQRGYSLTVVFSSSVAGATFEGAIGSRLLVDQVRIICTEEE